MGIARKAHIVKILLVYPKQPETFWSFKYALKFISRKAPSPPLGLLTVAALLPQTWEKRLVDLNVEPLRDRDLRWADYVFVSAMSIQRESAKEVLARCRQLGIKTVAGGPLFTTSPEQFPEADHLVLNEAEITLPEFVRDVAAGRPAPLYRTDQKADLSRTPLPQWDLVKMKKYAVMTLQYSRGCPFNCDFCDITALYGHRPRLKDQAQIIAELDHLHRHGWRGDVFFVDDNFIGNKVQLTRHILPAMDAWMRQKGRPFNFFTQASINLADDDELLTQMVKTGFSTVFVGIESAHEDSLNECSKTQNTQRDMIASIQKCQRAGLQVQGGFIIGFDNDPVTIFDKTIQFIQSSGIVTAMVGLLNAVKGTKLYQRLDREQRLIQTLSGDNTDCSINFIPKMNYDTLIAGYKRIVSKIYSPQFYYARVKAFLKSYQPSPQQRRRFQVNALGAFLKSIWHLGILGQERLHYWRLLTWSLLRRPSVFSQAVTFSIFGFHFRKIFEKFAEPASS